MAYHAPYSVADGLADGTTYESKVCNPDHGAATRPV